tara:strand:- start:78 stop:554 length:477 start_codon:yes stop_codon:yes gene_type:complete
LKPKIKSGRRARRIPRPKEKNLVVGYDSNWEYELHTGMFNQWAFHTEKIPYIVEHNYQPDFVKQIGDTTILLEAKGRFWDHSEYNKYVWIAKALPKDTELVFLFADPEAPMPQAKRRRDGTRRSHCEWASSKGFRWFSEDSIPDDWIDVTKRGSLDDE